MYKTVLIPSIFLMAFVAKSEDMAANDKAAMQVCIQYAEAQEKYHRSDYDNDGVLEYSHTLKGDFSLLETKAGSADLKLIDKEIADAESGADAKPYKGYLFKVLMAQGENAHGGKKSYLLDGKHLSLGYALVAYPSEYGVTGKRTFIINSYGTVYCKDLGDDTKAISEKMTEFDPDNGWKLVDPDAIK